MSKVMIFSTAFPGYHPRSGEPTFFPEKIWNSFRDYEFKVPKEFIPYADYFSRPDNDFFRSLHIRESKHHTIRAGNRWKVGDIFSPRVWSGKPYRSKQIEIAPDIEVKKVWDIHFDSAGVIDINGFYTEVEYDTLAKNDGLSLEDFHFWFPLGKEFTGQIICWNENIKY